MTVFRPKSGDMLYTAPDAPFGSKPIGHIISVKNGGLFVVEARRGERREFNVADVLVIEHSKIFRSWTISWKAAQ